MDCAAAHIALSAHLDGELTPAEEQELQEHLALCPQCRALQEELSALQKLLRQIDLPSPPPELKERVMAHLPPQGKPKGKVMAIHWKRWGAMAAAAALVIASAIWFRLPSANKDAANAPLALADAAPSQTSDPLDIASPENEASTPSGSIPISSAPSDGALEKTLSNQDDLVHFPVTGEAVSSEQDAPSPSASPSGHDYDVAAPEAAENGAETPPITARQFTFGSLGDASKSDESSSQMMKAASAANGGADSIPSPATRDEETPETLPENVLFSAMMLPTNDLERVAQLPDVLSDSLGTLTLTSAPVELLQGFYQTIQEGGSMLYRLPAAQFYALIDELDENGVEYTLDTTDDSFSPTAAYGQVVISHPIN